MILNSNKFAWCVLQVSGVVYLSANVAERLLSCHVPLDSCTYLGLDSGATPICVSFVLVFHDAV